MVYPYLTPQAYGLLNAIAGPESGGKYNVIYGGKTFNDFSRHPGISSPILSGPNAGKTSSAAGKYQFLAPTWKDISTRYHLPDFGKESQDKGAWYLAQEAYKRQTGGDLQSALAQGKIQEAARALSPTWTSLSGGIEAQAQGAGRGLMANYMAGMKAAGMDTSPGAMAPQGFTPTPPTRPGDLGAPMDVNPMIAQDAPNAGIGGDMAGVTGQGQGMPDYMSQFGKFAGMMGGGGGGGGEAAPRPVEFNHFSMTGHPSQQLGGGQFQPVQMAQVGGGQQRRRRGLLG